MTGKTDCGAPGCITKTSSRSSRARWAAKKCIRRLRITVYDVLDYLASGMTEAEILADLPDLLSHLTSQSFWTFSEYGFDSAG